MENALFLIMLLIAAAILIIALTHCSLLVISATKWKRQAEVYRRHQETTPESLKRDTSDDDRHTAPVDFSALINAIKAEGRANRAEERLEHIPSIPNRLVFHDATAM
jgi:hypothetical protein